MARTIYHVGVSGGKDSTALLLFMVYESGISHTDIVASFCDTQNEADCTYEHIHFLSREVFPITWIQTEGFYNLAKRKKRFPSPKARFCTQELKLKPTMAFLDQLAEECDELIPCSGVRRGESIERAGLSEWGNPLDSYFNLREWRPLIDWTITDVLAIHQKYNVPLNPLYSKGARRVGCFPCIMSSKPELRSLSQNFPERVEQLRQWENDLASTFYPPNMIPARYKSKSVTNKKGEKIKICSIDDVITWARSGYRAKGQAPDIDGLFDDQIKDLPPQICLAQHLACE
jgi:3'-phosphoadenosine 5'-phosphosulfate sulfotransferase (PAPS reductase)/FAD synthetase